MAVVERWLLGGGLERIFVYGSAIETRECVCCREVKVAVTGEFTVSTKTTYRVIHNFSSSWQKFPSSRIVIIEHQR